MNDYFTFFYVKHFELPMCMKCAIQINLPCLALPSSSPLLSLVTSTSEISHQPVHTYTTYIYDKGVDRTGRQGIEEKYSITWGEEKKNNPQTMLLGEYSVRTGKTPQQQKAHKP